VITIRASSLPSYLDCQLRAAVSQLGSLFLAHGHEVARPYPNIGALVGTGVHAAAEVALTERMMAGTLSAVSTMEDAAVDAFRARRTQELEEGAGPVIMDGESPTMDAAEHQVARMARQYRQDVVATARPLAVENRITIETGVGDVMLSGQSDLLHLDDQRTGNVVRDLKNSRAKPAAVKHIAQIGAYSLLFRSQGHETHGAQIDHLARVKVSKVQPPVEHYPLDVAGAERIAHAVTSEFATKALALADDGDPGRFLVNPASNLCNAKFCRAYGCPVCPATGGSK
jgi:hypothetical protein